MTTNNQFIAVQDLDSSAVGALVYWRLSGTTNLHKLTEAWVDAGLPESQLPSEPGPELAASRAVSSLKRKDRMVTRLKATNAWVVNNMKVDEKDVGLSLECRVRFDRWIRVEPENHPLRGEIENAFENALGELTQEDTSSWLVKQVKRLRAASLRDTGGFYFIPRFAYKEWRQMVDAVRAATGHTICEIPAVRSDEAIDAIVLAITEEANESAEALAEQIQNGEHGARWLSARAEKVKKSLGKINQYESLLGRKMDDLKAKVDKCHAELVAAALAAQAEADAEADKNGKAA